jgi:hypothetical protein
VVLDRDYLTVPADQIKNIKPVMTMVGGRIVYDANVATQAAIADRKRSTMRSAIGCVFDMRASFGAVAELSHSGGPSVAGW